MKNKKIFLLGAIFGVMVSSITVVTASLLIGASEVAVKSTHTDKTNVADSLDEIYTEIDDGKSNIINSLNNKGLELGTNSTYQQIVNGINSIPFAKTEDGEWGSKGENDDTVSPLAKKPRKITVVYRVNFYGGKQNPSVTDTMVWELQEDGTYSLTSGGSVRSVYGLAATENYPYVAGTLISMNVEY